MSVRSPGHAPASGTPWRRCATRSADVDDVELDRVHRLVPVAAAERRHADCRCRRCVAHRLWAVADRPRVDRFLGRPDVVHGTNYVVPPCRAPQVVSVYDCWFLRHPTLAGADGAPGRPSAAPGDRTRRDRSRQFGVDGRRDRRSVPRRRTSRRSHSAARPDPRRSRRIRRSRRWSAARTSPRSARSNDARTCPILVEAFGLLASEHDEILLVLAGADGDDRPAIDAAIDALDPAAAKRVVHDRARRRAGAVVAASQRHGARLPVARRGLRVPAARRDAGRRADRGQQPRQHPRGVRRGRAAVRRRRRRSRWPTNLASAAFDDDRSRPTARRRRRRSWRTFSWQRCATDLAALYRRLAGQTHA